MRKLWIGAAAVLLLLAVVALLQVVAAESGEVVVLRSFDAEGGAAETRLWIVDHDGAEWLRAGNPDSSWLVRLRAQPEVEVERGGQTRRLRCLPEPAQAETINRLMAQKYGWSDAYIGLFASREAVVPIRLVPPEGG